MQANRFKHALLAGELQLGLWMALADSYAAELVATLGYDWVAIDAEHAPNTITSILAQLQAVAPYDVEPVVRVSQNDAVEIKRMLDLGVRTIMVPMVDTAEDAARAVAAVHYPPRGVRGVGSMIARAARWGQATDYLATIEENLCLLVQLETVAALDSLEEICAVDGIDGVFVGAADLAADMGLLGQQAHPEVQARVCDALARIRRCGKPAGMLSADQILARAQIDAGATFAVVGTDVGLLAQAGQALLAQFRTPAGSTG